MTDIMKLADEYIAQLLSDVGRQYGFRRVTATTDGKARAALQAAIEALQGEVERLKAFAELGVAMYEMTTTVHSPNIEFSEQLKIVPSLWTKCMEERDALQAENERLKRDIDHQITAFNAVADALNKAAPERDALQAKLDELQKQEPIYQFSTYTPNQWVDMTKEAYEKVKGSKDVRVVYAAPKALAPEQVEAAWRAGWAACRDAEYVGQEAEDEAWGMSDACANADWDGAAPNAQHPDDIAVDKFAAAMKAKMAKQRAKGRGGWDDKEDCPTERLQQMLVDHIAKGDPADVGNFAMMLWNRGEVTAAPKALEPVMDELITRIFDTHVGEPTLKYPLNSSDWKNFAHAILEAAGTKFERLPQMDDPVGFVAHYPDVVDWTGEQPSIGTPLYTIRKLHRPDPVGWIDDGGMLFWRDKQLPDGSDIYAYPVQRAQLTEKEIDDCWDEAQQGPEHGMIGRFARALEAAHGITKGTP